MAERNSKDLVTQLTDLSEAAIQKLSEAPGADKAVQAIKKLAERVDELSRRTKGYEELEHRLTLLEKKVSRLAKASSTTAGESHSSTSHKSEQQPAGHVGRRVEPGEDEKHDRGDEPHHERRPRPRPRRCEGDRDERASQRVPARPRRIERR